jgi:thioredoxin reductase
MEQLHHDYIIVGGGPAGLQLGYFLEKSKRDYLILERGDSAGTFFKTFPTHRKLISANKVYTGYSDPVRNMRWDWNSLISDDQNLLFKNYSTEYFPDADVMVDYLADFAKAHKLEIQFGVEVERVSKGDLFELLLNDGSKVTCNKLIMATGVSKSYVPDIPGIELAENYSDASVDPKDYVDQRVLILGKGNSAFETADNLVGTASRIYVCSPTPITLSWKSKFVGHLRAINNNFIDTYQLKLQNVMLDAHLTAIEKTDTALKTSFHYVHADDEIEHMEFDRVILCTGFRFDDSIFDDSCRPVMNIKDRFPAQTGNFESTNIQDLFFIGTIMQERDFKKKQSGFVHGFRHNIESVSRYLEERYHNAGWPATELAQNVKGLAEAVLERSNRSPGLWQQTGFLCDVIARRKGEQTFNYYEDLTTQSVLEGKFKDYEEYHVVTLEFGLEIIYASPDPLAVERIHKDDVERAHLSTGIHPIVKSYSFGTSIGEHHVVEDIIPEWDEYEIHAKPLEEYFERVAMQVSKSKDKVVGTLVEESLESV